MTTKQTLYANKLRRKLMNVLHGAYVHSRQVSDTDRKYIQRVPVEFNSIQLFDEIDDRLEMIECLTEFLPEDRFESLYPGYKPINSFSQLLSAMNFYYAGCPRVKYTKSRFDELLTDPYQTLLTIAGGVDFIQDGQSRWKGWLGYPRVGDPYPEDLIYKITDRKHENIERYCEKMSLLQKHFRSSK